MCGRQAITQPTSHAGGHQSICKVKAAPRENFRFANGTVLTADGGWTAY